MAAAIGAGARRCGQRQNARAYHADCVAAAKRAGKRAQHYGGNVYQQGRERDANAAGGDAAD